jgi:uncharacterized OB-fold protein
MAEPSAAWEPAIYHDTVAYWAGCKRRELLIARCKACGRWMHPPRAVCQKCWSDVIVHESVSGDAIVYSFTSLAKPNRYGALTTVWGELAEQERLILVADFDDPEPRMLSIGDTVTIGWRPMGDTFVPVFRRMLHR